MTTMVEMPLWVLVLILVFAAAAALEKVLVPSVRWFFRRRMERVVARLNERLERPIQPFKLAKRYDMIQRLIYDPEVSQAIADHARENGVPENVAFEEARNYAREIVPSFSASAYFGFAIRLARYLSNALYRVRFGYVDEKGLKAVPDDATVVFVMNHRSNMDYVLTTYLAAQQSALSYAVGEWARVWPFSRLIKAMGAYFIRRKSRNGLYRKVLARYVHMATDGGVTQAIFPEGGLSLDGNPQEPKVGLLKYITESFDDTSRDVVFVPVALNYDRVLEDRVLLEAHQVGKRKFRVKIGVVVLNLLHHIWLRMTGKYHRFGYAAVSFGHPLSLRAFAQERGHAEAEPLARELMTRIESVVPVLPVPLMALMLEDADEPLNKAELEAGVVAYMERFGAAHVHLPRQDMSYAIEVGLRMLIERRMVEESEAGFSIIKGQELAVAFYANSIRHLLA